MTLDERIMTEGVALRREKFLADLEEIVLAANERASEIMAHNSLYVLNSCGEQFSITISSIPIPKLESITTGRQARGRVGVQRPSACSGPVGRILLDGG
jgi:hypothetical protein